MWNLTLVNVTVCCSGLSEGQRSVGGGRQAGRAGTGSFVYVRGSRRAPLKPQLAARKHVCMTTNTHVYTITRPMTLGRPRDRNTATSQCQQRRPRRPPANKRRGGMRLRATWTAGSGGGVRNEAGRLINTVASRKVNKEKRLANRMRRRC